MKSLKKPTKEQMQALLWKAWKEILLWCLQSPAKLFYDAMNISDGSNTEKPWDLLISYNIADLHETTNSAEGPSHTPLHKLISTEILTHFFKTVEVRGCKKPVFR